MRGLALGVGVIAVICTVPRPTNAEGISPYLGASVARSEIGVNAPSSLTANQQLSLSGHATGFKVEAGVNLLPELGFELEYADFGETSSSQYLVSTGLSPNSVSDRARLRASSAFAIGRLPIGKWDLFAKLGGSYWDANETFTATLPGVGTCSITDPQCATPRVSVNDHGIAFAYGAGVARHFGPFAIRAEYERFQIGSNTSLLSIGATWSFL